MTWWLIAWLSWSCLGDKSGFWGEFKPIPQAARPAAAMAGLCRSEVKVKLAANRKEMEALVSGLAANAEPSIYWCGHTHCFSRAIERTQGLKIDGRRIE